MHIYIVSRGRHEECPTLESLVKLPPSYKRTLVVHKDETCLYEPLAKKYRTGLLSFDYENIGEKRLSIGQQAGDKFVMMDDDLTFFKRKSPTDWHLTRFVEGDAQRMMDSIDKQLDTFAHVGVSGREGQTRLPRGFVFNTRYMRVLAYQKQEYLACEHNRVQFMEDFDINLQLLRKGYPSCILTNYAHNQKSTQAKGGCSRTRTKETHALAATKLKELHPDFVTLQEKQNKTGGDFGTRLEVRVKWKRALASAHYIELPKRPLR